MSSNIVVVSPGPEQPEETPTDNSSETVVDLAKETGQLIAQQEQTTQQLETISQEQQSEQSQLEILSSRVQSLETQAAELQQKMEILIESWEAAAAEDQDEEAAETVIEVSEEPAAENEADHANSQSILHKVIFGAARH